MTETIPNGKAHIELLEHHAGVVRLKSQGRLDPYEQELELIGTALSALYQAGTCHRRCHGGPHVLESLSGRIYNLGTGAWILINAGLYDEALNLIRSIGEVANLIAMSVVDKEALQKWLTSDAKVRLRDFSPKKIREIVKKKEPGLLLAADDWYRHYCEVYTHVTPETKPNMHNEEGLGHAGCHYQSQGLKNSLDELSFMLSSVAMLVCRYFDYSEFYSASTRSLSNKTMAVAEKANMSLKRTSVCFAARCRLALR